MIVINCREVKNLLENMNKIENKRKKKENKT